MWLFFLTYDEAMKQIFGGEGVDIYLDWGGGNVAWTPGFGATVGNLLLSLGHLRQAPTIHIGQGVWSQPPDAQTAALFGHEVTHLFQGTIPSLSTQAEIAGFEVQYLLLEAMGQAPPAGDFIAELHELWTRKGGDLANYSDEDIARARSALAATGNWLNAREPGRPILQGFYGLIYGDAALSVSLNPIPIFQALGARYRPRPSPSLYGRVKME